MYGLAPESDGTIARPRQAPTGDLWDCNRRPLSPLAGHSESFIRSPSPMARPCLGKSRRTYCSGTWRPANHGKPLWPPPLNSVAFSPDGQRRFLWGCRPNIILGWGHQHAAGRPLIGRQDASSVAFSPDGKTIASGSADQTVILWDVANRSQLGQPLVGHEDFVSSVAFSPDGKILASGSGDRTIVLWDVAAGHWARSAATKVSFLALSSVPTARCWRPRIAAPDRDPVGRRDANAGGAAQRPPSAGV